MVLFIDYNSGRLFTKSITDHVIFAKIGNYMLDIRKGDDKIKAWPNSLSLLKYFLSLPSKQFMDGFLLFLDCSL